jgi:hypothetical protein
LRARFDKLSTAVWNRGGALEITEIASRENNGSSVYWQERIHKWSGAVKRSRRSNGIYTARGDMLVWSVALSGIWKHDGTMTTKTMCRSNKRVSDALAVFTQAGRIEEQ